MRDTWSMRHISATQGLTHNNYSKVVDTFQNLESYNPVSLLDLEPEDRYQRRQWLERSSLPFPATLYIYHHGNSLGNINYLWRRAGERDEEDVIKVVTSLKEKIPIYSTRAMKREFTNRYSSVKPAILRYVQLFEGRRVSARKCSPSAEADSPSRPQYIVHPKQYILTPIWII